MINFTSKSNKNLVSESWSFSCNNCSSFGSKMDGKSLLKLDMYTVIIFLFSFLGKKKVYSFKWGTPIKELLLFEK